MFTVKDVIVFEYFSGFSDSVWAISGEFAEVTDLLKLILCLVLVENDDDE